MPTIRQIVRETRLRRLFLRTITRIIDRVLAAYLSEAGRTNRNHSLDDNRRLCATSDEDNQSENDESHKESDDEDDGMDNEGMELNIKGSNGTECHENATENGEMESDSGSASSDSRDSDWPTIKKEKRRILRSIRKRGRNFKNGSTFSNHNLPPLCQWPELETELKVNRTIADKGPNSGASTAIKELTAISQQHQLNPIQEEELNGAGL